jgi:outer membrane protein OmpA-like peptidoglycan-associated protein
VPGRAVAIATPAGNGAPAAKGATVASVPFSPQSADLNDAAKAELDRVAKNIADKSLRQVELRAYATGIDPESRKIALARALVVRSYLIDRGVKSRIEVGGFSGSEGERVDIVVPNT